MKNIRFYEAEKYKTSEYEKVDDKIFKTCEIASESDDYLGLKLLDDPSNPAKEVFVTSIIFEAEPDLGENEPTDPIVSQYPLEDILDKFYLYVYDDFIEENTVDAINSYVEFASEDIEDIRNVLSIMGKHVYNVEEGDYIKLRIE